jgi:hypothetical protein
MSHFALPLLKTDIDIHIGKLPEKLNSPAPGMAFEAPFFTGRDPERLMSSFFRIPKIVAFCLLPELFNVL